MVNQINWGKDLNTSIPQEMWRWLGQNIPQSTLCMKHKENFYKFVFDGIWHHITEIKYAYWLLHILWTCHITYWASESEIRNVTSCVWSMDSLVSYSFGKCVSHNTPEWYRNDNAIYWRQHDWPLNEKRSTHCLSIDGFQEYGKIANINRKIRQQNNQKWSLFIHYYYFLIYMKYSVAYNSQ